MEKLANKITDFYITKNYIPEDKREIYCYGFKLIMADIINFSIVILSGILLGRLLESIVFLITLCGIRQFSGGFHAKTFWLCRLSMIITFLAVMIISELLTFMQARLWLVLGINVLCILFMLFFAPVTHPNKPLTEAQKKKNKIKAVITSLVMSVISTMMTAADIDGGVTISITLAAIVILMIIVLMKKGGNENV